MPDEASFLPERTRRSVEQRTDAAWLFDPAQGNILAASPTATADLALGPIRTPLPLDASMPAVRRLREIALSLGSDEIATADLLMWTGRGAVRRRWCISRTGDDFGLLLITAEEKGAETRAEASPPPPADDHATLRKIAARILNGHAAPVADPGGDSKAAPPGEPSPAAQNPPKQDGDSSPQDDDRGALGASARARLAHELKSPLSAISSASEVMKDESLGPLSDPRYRDYAASIHASAAQALAIVDRMLTAGRDAAEPPPDAEWSEIDMNRLLENLARGVEPQARARDLALDLDLKPGLPPITADAVSLRQIVDNLLTNALRYTGPGGRITITTEGSADRAVVVAITNTAQRDVRGSATTEAARGRASESGLGLGLPLVRDLAARLGATFRIGPDDENGTRAELSFPARRLILI